MMSQRHQSGVVSWVPRSREHLQVVLPTLRPIQYFFNSRLDGFLIAAHEGMMDESMNASNKDFTL